MKTLIISALIILSSFNSFSQTISLSEKQAAAVATAVVAGKYCEKEVVKLEKILKDTEEQIAFKDQMIEKKGQENSILVEKDQKRLEQLTSKDVIINDFKRLESKSRTSTFIYKVIAIAATITSVFLVVTK